MWSSLAEVKFTSALLNFAPKIVLARLGKVNFRSLEDRKQHLLRFLSPYWLRRCFEYFVCGLTLVFDLWLRFGSGDIISYTDTDYDNWETCGFTKEIYLQLSAIMPKSPTPEFREIYQVVYAVTISCDGLKQEELSCNDVSRGAGVRSLITRYGLWTF